MFFQDAGKFRCRYPALGFQDAADLGDGAVRPVPYALKERSPPAGRKAAGLTRAAISWPAPRPPRSARIVPGYSGSGRLRLSLAVMTCRATALSVASHPVTAERPHPGTSGRYASRAHSGRCGDFTPTHRCINIRICRWRVGP